MTRDKAMDLARAAYIDTLTVARETYDQQTKVAGALYRDTCAGSWSFHNGGWVAYKDATPAAREAYEKDQAMAWATFAAAEDDALRVMTEARLKAQATFRTAQVQARAVQTNDRKPRQKGADVDGKYMNPMTGIIDSYDGWWYVDDNGATVNAVDREEVVEVVRGPDGVWREA